MDKEKGNKSQRRRETFGIVIEVYGNVEVNMTFVLRLYVGVFSYTLFILCLPFSFSFNNNSDDDEDDDDDDHDHNKSRNIASHVDHPCSVRPAVAINMIDLFKSLPIHSENKSPQDGSHCHSFARGFEDFVVTWPPSNNTTSIKDDK